MKGQLLLLILSLFLLAGCTVGPKYETPEIDVPCEWHSEISDDMQSDPKDCFIWWESLNDPLLNSLLESAASQNLDLYIAYTRILESRAEQKGASAALYPHLDGSLTYGYARYNQKMLRRALGVCSPHHKGSGQCNLDFFVAGFDAEWEIDLFGRTAHEIAAANAKTESIEDEFCLLWVSLSAEIARNYIELRGMQMRLDVITRHIEAQRDTLRLTDGLIKAGFVSVIDKMQAEAQLNVLAAQKPIIELSINKAIHRLSVLLGYPPGELFTELCGPAPLPSLPCQLPIGIPSELLRRRPDIRKAERELAAATERVGSAIAALFPRLSLYGFVGEIAAMCSGNFAGVAGPQLLLPIFNSRLLEQDVCLNKIRTRQSLYQYQKTVLEALEETENAIASFNSEMERNAYLLQGQQISRENYELTFQLYEKGFKNYLEVLVINRLYLDAEDAYLQSQVDLLLDYVALYKALGGGWEE